MAKNVTRMPNKSPPVVSKTYIGGKLKSYPAPRSGGFTTMKLSPDTPANTNRSVAARNAAIRAKYPTIDDGWKLNSGQAAYGPKPPSTASKVANAAKAVAGGVARGAMRAAGPAGALASMTTPTGDGREAKPKGPLMAGNSKGKGPGGGSLSAPNRTAPSSSKMSVTGGRGVTAFGGSSGQAPKVAGGKGDLNSPYRTASGVPARTTPSRSGGASNSKGPAGPSGPNSSPSRSTTSSKGPSSGPTSAPSRTAPSKANLGTSRF
jgi:hypothetical protein